MKKVNLRYRVIFLMTFLMSQSFFGQNQKDEIKLIQSIWGLEKSAIVSEYMKFSEDENVKFKPLYEAYTTEYQKLGQERILIIAEYGENYEKIDDAKADLLMQKFLKNNTAIDKLQLKYFNKIKKALSPKRAAQFLQLDLYLQTMIRAELQNSIPFIEELDKKAH